MPAIVATAADWSFGRPAPDNVRSKGYSIALRYAGNDSRCLTTPERDRIYAAGMRLTMIGQLGAVDRPRGGYKQGRLDGQVWQDAMNREDYPHDKPIIIAVGDVGTPPGRPYYPTTQDIPQMKEYFRGAREVITRPCGVYGPYWVLEEFRNVPGVFCFWQTAGGSGAGIGTGGQAYNQGDGTWRRLSSLACMYQEYGSVIVPETDHNQVYDQDLRKFSYHPSDGELPEEEEDEMPMIHIWTSSKKNREWLESIGYVLPQSVVDDGGWDSNWAGLGAWEAIEGTNTLRYLTGENHDLLKGLAAWQSAAGDRVTIVDDGFMDDQWFQSRTVIPFDHDGGLLLPPELTGDADA